VSIHNPSELKPSVPPFKEYGDKKSDRTVDRHKGVKYTIYIPQDLDQQLEFIRPEPVPRTQMMILALRHYLDDCRKNGVHPRTLMPLPPRESGRGSTTEGGGSGS